MSHQNKHQIKDSPATINLSVFSQGRYSILDLGMILDYTEEKVYWQLTISL